MADYEVVVIGGGPAGYSAALKAAECGARVALIEAEKPGGACVNHSCIPTNILLDAALRHVEARELGVLGVFSVGDEFNLGRASARREPLINKISTGISAALRMRKVKLIAGRASFVDAHRISVSGAGEPSRNTADAFVVATGTRWEPSAIPGLPADRLLTPDMVQALTVPPTSAVIVADTPAEVPFGAEYAVLLAIAGTQVTLIGSKPTLLPALDAAIRPAVHSGWSDLGIRVIDDVTIRRVEGDQAQLSNGEQVAAAVVVAADPRVPFFSTLNLAVAGVNTTSVLTVDRACRTNVPHIYAAGDVTGSAMLTNVAQHMGEIAGENAAGGATVSRTRAIPSILHGMPSAGWIGLTEEAARAAGHNAVTGTFDLAYNARAITTGARDGMVKVVAERGLGEILGVHAVGPGIEELMAAAALAIQAEVTVDDLAATIAWHPSIAEGLIEAARRVPRP